MPNDGPEPYRLLDEKGAVEFLGISPGMMRKLRLDGRVAYIRIGSRLVRYRKEDLIAFVETSATTDQATEKETPKSQSIDRASMRIARMGTPRSR